MTPILVTILEHENQYAFATVLHNISSSRFYGQNDDRKTPYICYIGYSKYISAN